MNLTLKICPKLLSRNLNIDLIVRKEDNYYEPNIDLNTDINKPEIVEDMKLGEVRGENVILDYIMMNNSNDLIESQSLVISNELEFSFENILNTMTSPQRSYRSPT